MRYPTTRPSHWYPEAAHHRVHSQSLLLESNEACHSGAIHRTTLRAQEGARNRTTEEPGDIAVHHDTPTTILPAPFKPHSTWHPQLVGGAPYGHHLRGVPYGHHLQCGCIGRSPEEMQACLECTRYNGMCVIVPQFLTELGMRRSPSRLD